MKYSILSVIIFILCSFSVIMCMKYVDKTVILVEVKLVYNCLIYESTSVLSTFLCSFTAFPLINRLINRLIKSSQLLPRLTSKDTERMTVLFDRINENTRAKDLKQNLFYLKIFNFFLKDKNITRKAQEVITFNKTFCKKNP